MNLWLGNFEIELKSVRYSSKSFWQFLDGYFYFQLLWLHLPKSVSWLPNSKLSTLCIRILFKCQNLLHVRIFFVCDKLFFRMVKIYRQKSLQCIFIVLAKKRYKIVWSELNFYKLDNPLIFLFLGVQNRPMIFQKFRHLFNYFIF